MGDIIKRNGSFTLRWYEGGKRKTLASKQASHTAARRMLLEIEARVARGEAGIGERRQSFSTVEELIERFLREYSRPKLKDLQRYRAQVRSILKKALPHIGTLSVEHIKQSDIIKLRDMLGKKSAAGSVKNVLAACSAVFSWAVKMNLAPTNPCRGVERPAAAQALDFLSREEVRRLLDAAEAGATTRTGRMRQVAIALAVYTGLRKGELLGLRFIDLDLQTRRLTVARSYGSTPKSGKPRHLKLPQALVPLLRTWQESCPSSKEGLVLPLKQNVREIHSRESMLGLPKLMEEIGLRPVLHPWHMLRHTFASHFVMAGGNILALSKILGHADVKLTMIYAHLAPDFLGDEMDRLKY
jgi:integrase